MNDKNSDNETTTTNIDEPTPSCSWNENPEKSTGLSSSWVDLTSDDVVKKSQKKQKIKKKKKLFARKPASFTIQVTDRNFEVFCKNSMKKGKTMDIPADELTDADIQKLAKDLEKMLAGGSKKSKTAKIQFGGLEFA